MSLTQDDLQAIRGIVEDVVEAKVEDAKLQTAAAFAAVDQQFAKVHARLDTMQAVVDGTQVTVDDMQGSMGIMQQSLDRVERVQRAEVERNDRQDVAIKNIRKVLHTT